MDSIVKRAPTYSALVKRLSWLERRFYAIESRLDELDEYRDLAESNGTLPGNQADDDRMSLSGLSVVLPPHVCKDRGVPRATKWLGLYKHEGATEPQDKDTGDAEIIRCTCSDLSPLTY